MNDKIYIESEEIINVVNLVCPGESTAIGTGNTRAKGLI